MSCQLTISYQDVAITMGIVPENEHLLGLEGAGLIRRVHPSVTKFKPGERVLVFKKGAFANRVIATVERTYHIPDWMSYEVSIHHIYCRNAVLMLPIGGFYPGERLPHRDVQYQGSRQYPKRPCKFDSPGLYMNHCLTESSES